MSAKEMFEELGYEYQKNNNILNYHLEQNDSKGVQMRFGIFFNLDYKYYHTYAYGLFENGKPYDSYLSIDIKIHKAINKQIEELGWK